MSGGAIGDRRGTAAGSKGVGSGTATDSLGDHDGSQLTGRGSSAAAAAVDRRLTRSKARELGLGMQNAAWPELGGRKGKKRKLAAEEDPKELESLPEKKNSEEQEQRPERTQMPIPARGKGIRILRYNRDRGSVITKRDAQLLGGAPWLVHVSSTDLDGKEILRCSGTIIHWEKEKAWILTSYRVVFCKNEARLYSPMPKLAIHVEKAVHLPNKGKYDGKMLFFSERYRFALIQVESTVEVEPPSDGSIPRYSEKVLTLARDENLSLKLRHGTIMWEEEDFFLFVSCKCLPCGIGGPVINHDGEIVGMSCYYDDGLAIISMTTIQKCITMWTMFGCIARPILGMSFRTMKLLDIVRQDRLSYKYKISDGFIVDVVADHSDAEECGIRRGNVISFSNVGARYLPEFEDRLLNIALDSLNGTSQVNDFELEVNDLVGKVKRTIILPLQISYGSED
ncbi:unnamed protein product [Urochloa humidicola]